MDKKLANYFLDEVSEAFAFVVTEYFFAAPELAIDDKINFAIVTYMGKNVAIECILDEREANISCMIARVFDGKKALGWIIDDHGCRIREYLSKLLERRGVTERLFTRADGLEFRERIKVTLDDFASMLRKHGRFVLNDTPMAFE